MPKMASILSTIVDGFKSLLAHLEAMSKDVVSEIETYSAKVAQEIQILLTKAFADVKARISSLIKGFTAKIHSLSQKSINTNAGTSTSSFSQRLHSAAKAAETEAERLIRDAKTEAAAMVHEARDMIRRMADGLSTARGDVTVFIRKTGKDVFVSLAAVGEGAVSKAKGFFESAFRDVELDGSFVASHALQVGEVPVLAAFNPVMIAGFAAAGLILVGSHSYAESIINQGDQSV